MSAAAVVAFGAALASFDPEGGGSLGDVPAGLWFLIAVAALGVGLAAWALVRRR